MHEEPFFFQHGSEQLYAVMHDAASGAPTKLPFVFCHPFGEEKLWTHRVFVSFARELARRGHPVLRFDYRGNGDSGGAFSDSSVETALADLDGAIDVLRERVAASQLGLLGLRLGASLAVQAAARRADVDALVLWSPVVDGARYLQELLRINLTTQVAVYHEVRDDREALGRTLAAGGTVNVDGYEIGSEMGAQLNALSLLRAPLPATGRALIVQMERNEKSRPSAELEQLAGRLPGASFTLVQEEPFWKEILRFYETAPNLFATTLEWLERS